MRCEREREMRGSGRGGDGEGRCGRMRKSYERAQELFVLLLKVLERKKPQ